MGNLKYDLSRYQEWLDDGDQPGYIEVSCSDGSHVMRLITNRHGEGLWKRGGGPAPDYHQIAGTCEFGLPGSAQHLRRLMHREFYDMERMCEECGAEMPDEFYYSRRAAR